MTTEYFNRSQAFFRIFSCWKLHTAYVCSLIRVWTYREHSRIIRQDFPFCVLSLWTLRKITIVNSRTANHIEFSCMEYWGDVWTNTSRVGLSLRFGSGLGIISRDFFWWKPAIALCGSQGYVPLAFFGKTCSYWARICLISQDYLVSRNEYNNQR